MNKKKRKSKKPKAKVIYGTDPKLSFDSKYIEDNKIKTERVTI